MYILSHFFKDLLKNKLKVVLESFTTNLIDDITECLIALEIIKNLNGVQDEIGYRNIIKPNFK